MAEIPKTFEMKVQWDRLTIMFELQGELQRHAYGRHPGDITNPEERIQFIKDMHIALSDELHEFLSEVGWKPWATSRHVNESAAKGELVDAFHFFMNLCMAVGMTPEELFERYKEKRERNRQRQLEGYDGVEGKCPRCKRAFDDVAYSLGVDVSQMMLFRLPDGTNICPQCVTNADLLPRD